MIGIADMRRALAQSSAVQLVELVSEAAAFAYLTNP